MGSDLLQRSVRTADGWELPLAEYPPARARRAQARGAVYLQHGLGSNRRSFDLHPAGPSLARWLAGRGWRVFAGDLRGAGRAWPPAGRSADWTFSDYLLRDLPALAAAAADSAGGRVHLVGHSLGGILALGYAGREGRETAASVVTLGSALDYSVGGSGFGRLLPFRRVLELFPALPTRLAHRVWGPLSAFGLVPDAWHYNRANMERRAVLAFHARANADIGLGELKELASTFEGRGVCSAELGQSLADIASLGRAPWLSLAGAADTQCPAATARATFEALHLERREWLLAARALGFKADYGHVDLLLGRRAAEEIWPRVEAFLESAAP